MRILQRGLKVLEFLKMMDMATTVVSIKEVRSPFIDRGGFEWALHQLTIGRRRENKIANL